MWISVRHIQAQKANINTCGFAVGGAPLSAAWGFATALLRQQGLTPKGFALAVHDRQAHGEWNGNLFEPAQRRGSGFTYERTSSGLCVSSDYIAGGHTLSLQPVIEADMTVSVAIAVDADKSVFDVLDAVNAELPELRFAGGAIAGTPQVSAAGSAEQALADIGSAWWVMDRRDLLAGRPDKLHAFVNALGRRNYPWISAACCGWATTTGFSRRADSRNGYVHAWGEPLIGLVQYVQPADLPDDRNKVFWQAKWHDTDAFVFSQPTNPSINPVH